VQAPASWTLVPLPRPDARVRLLCFPYAGGGASAYRLWPASLPDWVEVCAMQLPGRENRLLEPARTEIAELLPDLADAVRGQADRPFAFFGHSMGALIAYELARFLRNRELPVPIHLFASGNRPPHLPYETRIQSLLSDDELVAELKELGGLTQELLDNPEYLELVLPVVRADLALLERYEWTEAPPLPCPLSAYGGEEDPDVRAEDLERWRPHTAAAFAVRLFPGGHFFVHDERDRVLAAVGEDLERSLESSA
jgi:medium-chain acyl-[acyl-carrier-protein] hydrolase